MMGCAMTDAEMRRWDMRRYYAMIDGAAPSINPVFCLALISPCHCMGTISYYPISSYVSLHVLHT